MALSSMISRLALSMLIAVLVVGDAVRAQDPVDSAAYLLVIDHSGSMDTGTNPTRWEEMVERAVGFLEEAPLESLVWIAVFDSPARDMTVTERVLSSDADRESLIQHLRRQRDPSGGTALYDTLAVAFDYASTLSERTPGRYVSVMVYTDGDDKDSRLTRDQILEQFGQVVDQNTNVWCFLTPLVDGLAPALTPGAHVVVGTPKRPVPVRVRPGSLQLGTPTQGPLALELELMVGSEAAAQFTKPLRVRWEGDFPASVSPASLPLEPGPIELVLTPADPSSLDAQREYAGRLMLDWPEASEAVLQGPREVTVGFQPSEPPRIVRVFPAAGAVVAVGEPVEFSVETLTGAKVRWDLLGDGTVVREGERVRHSFTGAGTYEVELTVADPATDLETVATLAIEAIDIGVGINPLEGPIFAGVPFTFTCTGRGGVTGFDWYVDGRRFPGAGPDGNRLTYTFTDPGSATVRVLANHPRARVESEALDVVIEAAPSLGLLEPQDAARLGALAPHVFRASVQGPVGSVRWVLTRTDGTVLRDVVVPVDKAVSESTLEHLFDEGDAGVVRIEAVAVLAIEGAAPLSSTAEVEVTPPVRRVALVAPSAGAVLTAEESVRFELELDGPGFTEVEWSGTWQGSDGVALSGRSSVTQEGRAVWSPMLPRGESGQLRVVARTFLEGGEAGPESTGDWTVAYPDVRANLSVTGGSRFDDPVRFSVSGDDLTSVEWEFGDGRTETTDALENQHTYGAHGRFIARIYVTGAGGKRRSIERLIDIPFDPPVASALMRVEGEESSSFAPDQIIDLVNASSGHYVSAIWTIDGEPLEADRDTLLFDDAGRGDHVLGLTVTAPRSADGGPPVQDRLEIPFRVVRYDHALFVLGTALLVAVLGIVGRLLWGNGPSRWKFSSALPFDMEENELTNPIRLKRYWSRWRSRALVPLDKLHLGNSPDRSRTLTIKPRSSIGSSLSFAALEYSERRADVGMAGSEIREQSENMMLWEVWDKDLDWDGQSPPDPSWSLRLTRPPGLGRHLSSDLILLTIAAISTAAAIYALFHHVYLSF